MKAQATSFCGCRAANFAQHGVGTDSRGGTENVWQPNTGLSIHWPLSEMYSNQIHIPLFSAQTFIFQRIMALSVDVNEYGKIKQIKKRRRAEASALL